MDINELLEELVGFYAYETGCVSSGVKDDVRRDELAKAWREACVQTKYDEEEAEWFREYFLSDDAIKQGYGMEDATNFYRWLEEDLL